ncbi:MAG: hypothetical protein VR66_01720 [Peptococcaceae bacterium BRH_c23]|nr:MAG: hypothetical protein VR66_01720 [Peptococcaceae bacterium BRH_c23]KJS88844.1 MAG: hypothetical protein JL57_10495 [Desulfosporosinus sp. BICA1-9]HBW37745.1 hypothetical protein [Desulfosporosinus sp.]
MELEAGTKAGVQLPVKEENIYINLKSFTPGGWIKSAHPFLDALHGAGRCPRKLLLVGRVMERCALSFLLQSR